MQAVKTIPHNDWGKESHFSTEYRKTPLPADKKGLVREVQQSTRRNKKSHKETGEPASLKQARASGAELQS
jgi:hypothetical protein